MLRLAVILCSLFVLVNNSVIFKPESIEPDNSCDSPNSPFERHTKVNHLNETIEISLNKTFNEKFKCLQRLFDISLVEMQKVYNEAVVNRTLPTNQQSVDKKSKKKEKKEKKSTKHGRKMKENTFIGQVGLIFYTISQNRTVTQFKHESFEFFKPTADPNLNETISLLETELNNYNNDLETLKEIQIYLKTQAKNASRKLKTLTKTKPAGENEKKEKKQKKK